MPNRGMLCLINNGIEPTRVARWYSPRQMASQQNSGAEEGRCSTLFWHVHVPHRRQAHHTSVKARVSMMPSEPDSKLEVSGAREAGGDHDEDEGGGR